MNYKKKYEEALERAKNGGSLETIFPELIKENEDEKIRKALISTFQNRKKYCIADTFGKVSVEDTLAWLEKQGEVAIWNEGCGEWQCGVFALHNITHWRPIPEFMEGGEE